ncbi:putative polyol transporter 1 [Syzygium oleosum]|uniref:putative polyol transporter 1 n=1 Tax=Syzygium oleosum TaxID=219896 RepID=UPI0024B9ED99|nr:putative polyol transporter 1 [Syzygium oleosum]
MLSDQREQEGNLDNLEAPNQALIVKKCNGNDELQEARKGLINVLKDTCSDSKVNGNVQVKSIEEFDPPKKPHQNKYAFTTASMTSILLDYDIGVMSKATAHIKNDKRKTDMQVEVLMGILNVFLLLGLTMAG